MRKNLVCLGVIGTLLVPGLALAQIDSSVHYPANYTTMQPPANQSSYVDPTYATSIKRISDALHTPDAAAGGMAQYIASEYSTANPFSSDNSYLVLQQDSYFGLYDGSGAFIANLPLEISANSEPRWSRMDNSTLYYHVYGGNQLKTYNVTTKVTAVVQTFSNYYNIWGKGKTDISYDGDHFIFIGCTSNVEPTACPVGSQELFIYQMSTGSQFPIVGNNPNSPWNNVFISPDNEAVVSWLAPGTGRFQGVEIYDQKGNFLRQIAHADGHSKMSRDINGDEVFIWANSADPWPLCGANAIVKVHMADGVQTCLQSFDWSFGLHITAADNTWVFAETYTDLGNDVISSTGWLPYMDELLQIKMDGSEVRRLAQHRSRPLNGYDYMPKLSASRDGSRFAYGSNFGLQLLDGAPQQYMDAYLVMVPQTAATITTPGGTGSGSTSSGSTSSGATGSGTTGSNGTTGSSTVGSGGTSLKSIVNGASYQPALAPGSIVSIFGSGFSGSTITAASAYLPPFLGSVNVYFDGIPAPLFYVSPGQINAQVPYGVTPGTVNIEVDGLAVVRQTAAVSATAPGIFTTTGSGTGPGVILRADDYQLVSASAPTQAGAFISIYCTGLGALASPVVEGNPGPSPALTTVAVPQVSIGNIAAPVTFSGLAPGFAGLYQVNAQVPTGVPAGNAVPVVIAVAGVSSNTATIVVQ